MSSFCPDGCPDADACVVGHPCALHPRVVMHRLLVSPEYGIRLDDGHVVIGPDWESPADVINSYHGFGTTRVYGQLVVRTEGEPRWQLHPR